MEGDELRLTRKRDILPPIGRTTSENVGSPFRSDDGKTEDYGDARLSRFGETGMSRFRDTGMSKFGDRQANLSPIPNLMPSPLPNMSSLQTEMVTKADAKAEVHFIGQIVGGSDFNCDDGLFCEMLLSVGDTWKMLSPPKLYQTQVCYAKYDNMFIWSHPVDLFFSAGDLHGWPKVVFRVWRLDASNKMDTFSYGVAHLPRSEGHHRIECNTWTPIGSWRSSALNFFMGTNPRLHSMDVMSDFLEKRAFLNSSSSGKVILDIDVLMKNFSSLGISGQSEH